MNTWQPGMENTLIGFSNYCESYGIKLTNDQISVAESLFEMSRAKGKTLLIAMLYAFDPSTEKVLNNMCSEMGLCPNIH